MSVCFHILTVEFDSFTDFKTILYLGQRHYYTYLLHLQNFSIVILVITFLLLQFIFAVDQ